MCSALSWLMGCLAAMLILAVGGIETGAKPPPPKPPAHAKPKPAGKASLKVQFEEAQVLRQAYAALAVANYDYNGHKAAAMRTIRHTIHALNKNIMNGGDAKLKVATKQAQAVTANVAAAGAHAGGVHEQQVNSDAQVRQAVVLLANVRKAAIANNQPWVRKQSGAAIKELRLALATR